MAIYGYARVSSSDQSTDTQVQRLKAVGCQVVRTEKVSGKSREGRDQLATLLEFIGPGDVLVCVKLDRLGCLVPRCAGVIYAKLRREGLWDKFYMDAPARQRQCVEQYN